MAKTEFRGFFFFFFGGSAAQKHVQARHLGDGGGIIPGFYGLPRAYIWSS